MHDLRKVLRAQLSLGTKLAEASLHHVFDRPGEHQSYVKRQEKRCGKVPRDIVMERCCDQSRHRVAENTDGICTIAAPTNVRFDAYIVTATANDMHRTLDTYMSSTLSKLRIMFHLRRNWLSSFVAAPVSIICGTVATSCTHQGGSLINLSAEVEGHPNLDKEDVNSVKHVQT